ncbi:MAG: DUF4825 domain-containing protein [Bacillota bacterium]|nr:DUF4825 domain-containing protein [Bacillota bacterium]
MKNKRSTKILLLTLGAVAVILAAGLLVMHVLGDREASAAGSADSITVEALSIDDSKSYAKELLECKVDDVNDTAAVAKLFDAMKLEEVTGEYTVTISAGEEAQVLSLTLTKPVAQADKETFDANMQLCAQQMLALIPQVGEVQWNYSVLSDSAKEEAVSVSLDEAGATKELGKNVKNYGNSAGKLQKLLEKQAS